MNRKAVIATVIILIVIIIAVVIYLIYRSNKKNKDLQLQQQADILQQQLNNPALPPTQRQGILAQLAILAAQIAAAKQAKASGTPTTWTPPIYDPTANIPDWTPPWTPPGTPVNNPAPTWTPVGTPSGFPLRKGSSGGYVKTLQQQLNSRCGKGLVTDGKFGPLTESAAIACIGTSTVSWAQFKQYTGTTILG